MSVEIAFEIICYLLFIHKFVMKCLYSCHLMDLNGHNNVFKKTHIAHAKVRFIFFDHWNAIGIFGPGNN